MGADFVAPVLMALSSWPLTSWPMISWPLTVIVAAGAVVAGTSWLARVARPRRP